jgi:glycosyltransferase involved in cell wall biosynthesis
MRILRLDSWDGQAGGAQDYIRTVSAGLAGLGHETRVLNVVSQPSESQEEWVRPVQAAASGPSRVAFDLVDAPRLSEAFHESIRSFHPDIIHLHHFDAGFTTIAKLLRHPPAPLVFTAHDAELVCPISTLVRPGNIVCEGGVLPRCLFTGCHVGLGGPYNLWQRELFDRMVAPNVRAYFCPSHSVTGYLHHHGYRPAVHLPSFAAIPDGVYAAATPPPASDRPSVIGYLGRLEPYKGVHDLIDAMALLPPRHRSARLSIAGEGPYRPDLERRVAARGVQDRVEFAGRVAGPAKEEWFARVSLVATPSNYWENFPLVALEGLARGRPVVATEIGGIPDIVQNGETGLLVPISRPDALAQAITALLDDPAKAESLGAEGRRRVLSRFTPQLHIGRLTASYRAVLEGRTLGSPVEADSLSAPG